MLGGAGLQTGRDGTIPIQLVYSRIGVENGVMTCFSKLSLPREKSQRRLEGGMPGQMENAAGDRMPWHKTLVARHHQ